MPDEKIPQLHESLRFHPWPIGDYFVLVDSVLKELEGSQQKQIVGMYLESVAATLQANLKLVEGIRGIVASGKGQR